jgi:hypothetical protein
MYLISGLFTFIFTFFINKILNRIDELKEEKSRYSHVIDIVQKAIPLFPPGKNHLFFLYKNNFLFV